MTEPRRERQPADATARRETAAEKQRRLFGRGRDTGRIEYFSDAVFAIALTLLVLDLRAPELGPGEALLPAVLALWPKYLGYGLSFAIIAINWIYHHRKFRAIVRYDTPLIWINFAFLFFVALVPYPTSLLSEYAPDITAVVLYAGVVAALGLVASGLWAYAHRAGLLSPAVDEPLYRLTLLNNVVVPAVFLLSILVALFLDPGWAMWFWILSWPASVIVGRLAGRRPAAPEPEAAGFDD